MGKKITTILFLIAFILPIMAQNEDIKNSIKQIETEFAPDKRVVVFDVNITEDEGVLSFQGETSSIQAYEKLNEMVSEKLKNGVRLLPDDVIGEKKYGIIYNSMGTIHRGASYSSETVTQTLLGTPVNILDRRGGWFRIQTPDNYIGWINGAVQRMTKEEQESWLDRPKMMVSSLFAGSYLEPDQNSQPVSDLVVGNILTLGEEFKNFYEILYPDNRKGFIRKSDALKLEKWNPEQTKEAVVETTKRFLGVPYVWGGTTSKGLDCSGLTQSVYYLHNVVLPRDASQQILTGMLVDEVADFDQLEPGDLVFFGEKATDKNPKERVVHVGIYIGNWRFIHASDYVRINSFNPDDELYDDYNTNRYLRTKRILGDNKLKSVKGLFIND